MSLLLLTAKLGKVIKTLQLLNLYCRKMPIYRERYADHWDDIALAIKAAAHWRCRHCNQQSLRPGEKPKELTRSEWTMVTLSVHHANFTPEDNQSTRELNSALFPIPPCVAQSSARQNEYNTRAVGVSTLGELRIGVWGAMSATGYVYA